MVSSSSSTLRPVLCLASSSIRLTTFGIEPPGNRPGPAILLVCDVRALSHPSSVASCDINGSHAKSLQTARSSLFASGHGRSARGHAIARP
jgi:hypothetical protein